MKLHMTKPTQGTHGQNPTPAYFDIVTGHMIRTKSQKIEFISGCWKYDLLKQSLSACAQILSAIQKKDFIFTCTNKLEYCFFFLIFFLCVWTIGVYKLLGILWYVTILSTSPLWVCSFDHVKIGWCSHYI